jgi:hypothetical protein
MTSPPQPHRHVTDDLDLGVTGNQVPVANQKRAAANQRQREQGESPKLNTNAGMRRSSKTFTGNSHE